MNFRGVVVGKIIETIDDLMDHSYPLAPKAPEVDPAVEAVEIAAEAKKVEQEAKVTKKAEKTKSEKSKSVKEKETVDKLAAEMSLTAAVKAVEEKVDAGTSSAEPPVLTESAPVSSLVVDETVDSAALDTTASVKSSEEG